MRWLALSTLTIFLIISWLVVGVLTTTCGFLGCLYLPLSSLLGFPFALIAVITIHILRVSRRLPPTEKGLLVMVLGVLLLHATGLLVPETGFDAVWYHLPVVKEFSQAHRMIYLPELYQSLNPLFSDLIFLLGFQVAESVGTKLIAYAFGLSLLLVSYQLSRYFLSRKWSLIVVLVVATFQVVSWQMTSFYVDLAKAFWEVSALWLLIKNVSQEKSTQKSMRPISWWFLGLSALCLSASLGTKLFSIVLLPFFGLAVCWLFTRKRWLKTSFFLILTFGLAIPFWWRSVVMTGHPFLSANLHLGQIQAIGGSPSLVDYLIERTWLLPTSPFFLTFAAKDYVTLLLFVFGILVGWSWKLWRTQKEFVVLLIFGMVQWLVWWYIPPVSTRYALSGFVVLTLCCLKVAAKWIHHRPEYRWPFYLVISLSCLINLVPRVFVARRSIEYVLQHQENSSYIRHFYDGNIDPHLKRWYNLPD